MFGKGQDKKVKVKADQATKQKTFNSTKNNKKQQFTGIQDEADWNVSTIDDIAWKVFLLEGETFCHIVTIQFFQIVSFTIESQQGIRSFHMMQKHW